MSNKLYVGNLNYSITDSELKDFFSTKYEVTDCKVIEGKGFGFMTFTSEANAAAAKEEFNNQELKGRALKIDIAKERAPRR